jgi:hypothetical protein
MESQHNLEDGSDEVLRNIGILPQIYTASQPRRWSDLMCEIWGFHGGEDSSRGLWVMTSCSVEDGGGKVLRNYAQRHNPQDHDLKLIKVFVTSWISLFVGIECEWFLFETLRCYIKKEVLARTWIHSSYLVDMWNYFDCDWRARDNLQILCHISHIMNRNVTLKPSQVAGIAQSV